MSNLGAITLASGSMLDLGGTFAVANIGKITNNGGTIDVAGTLNNAGKTLDGSGGLGALTLDRETVKGGIVKTAGLKFASGNFYGGGSTLNDVTFEGPLNLTGDNVNVALAGGTTVVGSSGSGPGVVNVTGGDAQVSFAGSQTVSNLTVNLGSVSYIGSYVRNDDASGAGQTLTFAASTAIDFIGNAVLDAGSSTGDGIVNRGLIDQTGAWGSAEIEGKAFTNAGTLDATEFGGNIYISSTTFSNSGTIEVANQGEVFLSDQTNFTNLASGTLTGGVYDIAGGEILVYGSSALVTLAADLTLSGSNSSFITVISSNYATSSFDASLTTIASTGALSLLDDRNWTTAGAAIADKGVITLGGGEIAATATGASLTIASGGKLVGFGAVAANSLTNSGTIEAAGGPLNLDNAVTGTGTLQIDSDAKLVANAAIASTQTVSFQGTGGALELLSPDTFAASIKGFAAGDTLLTTASFGSFVENSAGTSGTLTLKNGSATDMITLVGDYSSTLFTHSTSGGLTTISYA